MSTCPNRPHFSFIGPPLLLGKISFTSGDMADQNTASFPDTWTATYQYPTHTAP